jgi:hypothetical protein
VIALWDIVVELMHSLVEWTSIIPADLNFTVTNHNDCAVLYFLYDLEAMAFMFFDMLWS